MDSILVIEDERVIRSALRRLLERNGYQVTEAGSVQEACDEQDPSAFDLIISDLRLPGEPGTGIIAHSGEAPVLIMTSYASVKSAVEAMQLGAVDYIAKPFDHQELLHSVNRILAGSRLRRQNAALKSDLQRDYPVAGIIGQCEGMQKVFETVHKVAPIDTTVLVLGESGTGKELVARAVHEQSKRRDAPLITVNCASIAEGLMEAELFGHQRGAFTGAVESREGLVEAAHGGTLFLDEIGELSLAVQAQLLRVLQEGEVRRVGTNRSTKVDLRLIAATHRELGELVKASAFREDLYYRLRVVEIQLPALRERGTDVPLLAKHMLSKTSKQLNRPDPTFTSEALEAICSYSWPGNVRELENAVERAVILCDGNPVTAELLALERSSNTARGALAENEGGVDSAKLSLDDYFVHFVTSNQDGMTETELAKRLGISRKSLWERRQKLGIPKPERRPT